MNTRLEDATAAAAALSDNLYGQGLDGAYVAGDLLNNQQVSSDAELASLLEGTAVLPDGRVLLSLYGESSLGEAAQALRGRLVLSPLNSEGQARAAKIGGRLIPLMFPAMVVPEQTATDSLTVVVSDTPFTGEIDPSTGILLAGEVQSQHPQVASHGPERAGQDAGHFTALLTAGVSQTVNRKILNGDHVVHDWKKTDGIVVGAAAEGVFAAKPRTIQLDGRAPIAWHPNLLPYHAALPGGLELVQGLAYVATRHALDTVKQAAGAMG